jgi:hypothetical protein
MEELPAADIEKRIYAVFNPSGVQLAAEALVYVGAVITLEDAITLLEV